MTRPTKEDVEDDEESGAEWLARENKRLNERVRELEAKNRKCQERIATLEAKVVDADERHELLDQRYWSLLCAVEEAVKQAHGDD